MTLGMTCFAASTAYGDGVYFDKERREYSVDAGLLGIIPLEALDLNFEGDGGQIIEFDEDFTVSEEDGVFTFGDVVINTKSFFDEDDFDCEDDCDEDSCLDDDDEDMYDADDDDEDCSDYDDDEYDDDEY